MKQGDIIMIYTGSNPEGQAKLIELIKSFDSAEYWKVEFTDNPGRIYERLIQK